MISLFKIERWFLNQEKHLKTNDHENKFKSRSWFFLHGHIRQLDAKQELLINETQKKSGIRFDRVFNWLRLTPLSSTYEYCSRPLHAAPHIITFFLKNSSIPDAFQYVYVYVYVWVNVHVYVHVHVCVVYMYTCICSSGTLPLKIYVYMYMYVLFRNPSIPEAFRNEICKCIFICIFNFCVRKDMHIYTQSKSYLQVKQFDRLTNPITSWIDQLRNKIVNINSARCSEIHKQVYMYIYIYIHTHTNKYKYVYIQWHALTDIPASIADPKMRRGCWCQLSQVQSHSEGGSVPSSTENYQSSGGLVLCPCMHMLLDYMKSFAWNTAAYAFLLQFRWPCTLLFLHKRETEAHWYAS